MNPGFDPAPAMVLLSPYGAALWNDVRAAMDADIVVSCLELIRGRSLGDYADWALELCPPRFCLVGFCLGGAVAVEAARRAPERVAGLALINTALRADNHAQASARRLRIEKLQAKAASRDDPDPAYLAHAARWLVAPGADQAARRAQDLLARTPITRSLDQQRALLSRPDLRDAFASLRVPVLAISGEHDRICAPLGHADLPTGRVDASAHVLAGCGHLSPLEQPQAVAALLDSWLDRVRGDESNLERQDRAAVF